MFGHAISFAAGVVTGWTARSVFGSTRELAVRGLTVAIAMRERVRRAAAEQVEWWEDTVAEAKARYSNGHPAHDEESDDPIAMAH
jgi:hypothetical protein